MLQVQFEEQGFRVHNYSNPSCFSLIFYDSKTAISLKHPTALAPLAFLDWPELSLLHKSPQEVGKWYGVPRDLGFTIKRQLRV